MISIEGYDQLNKAIVENTGKQLLLYFGATWCGPCMVLKEKIEKNKEEIKDLVVINVDCDVPENEDIMEQYNITALPTQIFVHLDKDRVVNDFTIQGVDWILLVMKYNELTEKNN